MGTVSFGPKEGVGLGVSRPVVENKRIFIREKMERCVVSSLDPVYV